MIINDPYKDSGFTECHFCKGKALRYALDHFNSIINISYMVV